MIKRLIELLFVAALGYALIHAVPVYWNNYKFEDALEEMATFSVQKTEDELRDRVMKLASENDIPLDTDDVVVHQSDDATEILAPYSEKVEVLPRFVYTASFDVKVKQWHPGKRPK
jgi:hypothetical protein